MRSADLGSIGARITHIRGSTSQRTFAEQIGVPLKTYQTYEQGKREPDLRTLAGLFGQGWNLNWLLLGEGPERLEALQDKGSGDDSTQSQDMTPERFTVAFQLVEEALAARNAHLPIAKRVRAAWIVARLLKDGLAEAEVIQLSRDVVDLAEGDAVDGNRGAAAAGR